MENLRLQSKIDRLEKHVEFLDDSIKQFNNLLDRKDILIDELLELLKQNNL